MDDDDLEGIFSDMDLSEPDGVQDLDLEDKLLSSDDLDDRVDSGPDVPPIGPLEPVYAQPVNKATMVCLRGPCQHHWELIARYVAAGKDDIYIKAIRQCNCHFEETALGGQNIYHCSMWWPVYLSWVPESLRAILRPRLVKIYQEVLKLRGYDFSWKTWADDVFTSDRPELRGSSAPGGKRFKRKEQSLYDDIDIDLDEDLLDAEDLLEAIPESEFEAEPQDDYTGADLFDEIDAEDPEEIPPPAILTDEYDEEEK